MLGVPFYVMTYLDGIVPTDAASVSLESRTDRRALGDDLVDALVEIHAADVSSPGLAAFARPGSYNERQVRRFTQLWEINKTRDLPVVERVAAQLAAAIPEPPRRPSCTETSGSATRWSGGRPVEDPRRARLGDGRDRRPTRDVGYLLATYSEPGGPPSPLGTSPVTALEGFPSRAELVERYEAGSGRAVEPLGWFEALALWKAAVFCEAIYGRFLRGELGAEDERAARFEEGVPFLAESAAAAIACADLQRDLGERP